MDKVFVIVIGMIDQRTERNIQIRRIVIIYRENNRYDILLTAHRCFLFS